MNKSEEILKNMAQGIFEAREIIKELIE